MGDIREMVLREVRERMEGQRMLRQEIGHVQEFLQETKQQINEGLAEFRRELAQSRQEVPAPRGDFEQIREMQASCIAQIEAANKRMAEEHSARSHLERQVTGDMHSMRELLSLEIQRADANINEVRDAIGHTHKQTDQVVSELRENIGELKYRLDSAVDGDGESALMQRRGRKTQTGMQPINEESDDAAVAVQHEPVFARDFEEIGKSLDKLDRRVSDTRSDISCTIMELEKKITEEWTGLRGWVDAAVVAVVSRLSSLECALQSELHDRSNVSSKLQDSSDVIASLTDKMNMLQSTVDNLSESQVQTSTASGPSAASQQMMPAISPTSNMPGEISAELLARLSGLTGGQAVDVLTASLRSGISSSPRGTYEGSKTSGVDRDAASSVARTTPIQSGAGSLGPVGAASQNDGSAEFDLMYSSPFGITADDSLSGSRRGGQYAANHVFNTDMLSNSPGKRSPSSLPMAASRNSRSRPTTRQPSTGGYQHQMSTTPQRQASSGSAVHRQTSAGSARSAATVASGQHNEVLIPMHVESISVNSVMPKQPAPVSKASPSTMPFIPPMPPSKLNVPPPGPTSAVTTMPTPKTVSVTAPAVTMTSRGNAARRGESPSMPRETTITMSSKNSPPLTMPLAAKAPPLNVKAPSPATVPSAAMPMAVKAAPPSTMPPPAASIAMPVLSAVAQAGPPAMAIPGPAPIAPSNSAVPRARSFDGATTDAQYVPQANQVTYFEDHGRKV
eukprot:gnl/TRDRNA2_/TRDRNA2_86192_c0_seq1.p1 gnl/TRDRNA2_/TRDRNA2_86192_c0~~gnl/TRDRNA2_/TRDRNA2_86192_c0_seq1.p1  ORF type:complete len:795 (-),score=138.77 gnl/TRDRNA2_/TRDRNA2_86192_c0_seq1:149-2356(-)